MLRQRTRRLVPALLLALLVVLGPRPQNQGLAATAPQTAQRDSSVIYLTTRGIFPMLVEVQLFTPATDLPLTTAINGLIAGAPALSPLRSLLPPATRLNRAAVADGVATLDFSAELLQANVGSLGEAMLLASVANTAAQFPTVERTRLLVDGSPLESLAGHVDMTAPIGPNHAFRPAGFADSVRHWAERQINAMILRGVIDGYDDGTFRPDRAVSRAEFIKLVVAACGETDWSVAAQSFADVSQGHPLHACVEAAVRHGWLVPGDYRDADGFCRLRPEGACTRREAATLVVRAAGLAAHAAGLAGTGLPWADTAGQPGWAGGFLLAAAERGLMNGYPDGSFHPAGTLTRAEAATIIARLVDCRPGAVIAPAVRDSEAYGIPGLLVAGTCQAGALLRLDLRASDGTILSSRSLAVTPITDSCSYYAAITPAAELPATAATAEVLALSGGGVDDRWTVRLPPR
ncbi:MAG: S-layer homology domain-containing protein [Chloroflexota bacterium]